MSDKAQRQAALLRLARQKRLSGQEEIVRLMQKAGFSMTQASVSRDIRELGLVKVRGRYLPVAELPPGGRDAAPNPVPGLISEVAAAGANLVVVRTTAGGASAVAAAIDALNLPDEIGSIAGDDTMFIAVRSRSAQGRLVGLLRAWTRPVATAIATPTQARGA
ncbi:MAG: arginine repressor [Phycisphaerae bacterium]